MKKVIAGIAFMMWSLLCIYSTYYNTVEHAEITAISENGYEITYHNTGDVFSYNK